MWKSKKERIGIYYVRITTVSLGKVFASASSTVGIDSVILKLI